MNYRGNIYYVCLYMLYQHLHGIHANVYSIQRVLLQYLSLHGMCRLCTRTHTLTRHSLVFRSSGKTYKL